MTHTEKQFQQFSSASSVWSTLNFHKAILYCTLSFAMWLHPNYTVMCSLCLFTWEDASVCSTPKCFSGRPCAVSRWSRSGTRDSAVVTEPYLSLSELNSCWRWWHLSVSVTTRLALVFHAARQIDSPQSCTALADSQTALIGTNKSSFMHYSKVDSGASFKFNRGRLPSGHICQLI